jgi:ABC-type phosphate transport system substrate-binding protein
VLHLFLATALQAASVPALPPGEPPALAVIVNAGIPVDELSLAELRKVFLGDRQFWSGDLRVTLLVPRPGSPEREALLSRIYEKSEAQYRHYWIAKVFRTEVTAAPKVVNSDRMAADLVRQIEGAVAVVSAANVPPGVKVLKINDRATDDPDYPLR